MKIVDKNGNEQVLVSEESTENDVSLQIANNAIKIGKVFSVQTVTNQNMLQTTNNTLYEIHTKPGERPMFQYFDETNTKVGAISQPMVGPLVKLELKKN